MSDLPDDPIAREIRRHLPELLPRIREVISESEKSGSASTARLRRLKAQTERAERIVAQERGSAAGEGRLDDEP